MGRGADPVSLPIDPSNNVSGLQVGLSEGARTVLWLDRAGNLRTVARRPPSRGDYRIGQGTAAYAGIAANGELLQMRWTDPSRYAVIWQVSISVNASAAATAASQIDRQAIIARSWTTTPSGATAITPAPLRTGMAPSLFAGQIQISNGAALSAGTKTLDNTGVGIVSGTMGTNAITALGTVIAKADAFNAQGPNGRPIVLAQNEGLVVRMVTAQPAGSTLITYIDVDWSEVEGNQIPHW
jgi:hypothetical protein